MKLDNLLPYLSAFCLGTAVGLLVIWLAPVLIALWMRNFIHAEMPYPCEGGQDQDIAFDTRMSNEEWADAVIAEAMRRAGAHE